MQVQIENHADSKEVYIKEFPAAPAEGDCIWISRNGGLSLGCVLEIHWHCDSQPAVCRVLVKYFRQ